MKKLVLSISALILLVSCEKMEDWSPFGKHHKSEPCPAVEAASVPEAVKKSFISKHPVLTVDKWLKKDNHGYCAVSSSNGSKVLDFFDNDGNFEKEESGNNNNDNTEGCDCGKD